MIFTITVTVNDLDSVSVKVICINRYLPIILPLNLTILPLFCLLYSLFMIKHHFFKNRYQFDIHFIDKLVFVSAWYDTSVSFPHIWIFLLSAWFSLSHLYPLLHSSLLLKFWCCVRQNLQMDGPVQSSWFFLFCCCYRFMIFIFFPFIYTYYWLTLVLVIPYF